MRTLPPLNDACLLEHRVAEILTEQEIHGLTFDEQKAQQLESSLRREMEETIEYFEDNSLSLQDRCSLLNEITQHKDTEKDVKYNE